MTERINGYKLFVSKNPRLDFSFLYPGSWEVREIEERDYSEVFIIGPRNKDDTYSLSLSVSVIPRREAGGEFDTLDELMKHYLGKNKGSPGFKEISVAEGTFASLEAVEFVISYVMPLPLNAVEPKATTILERRIITARGPYFYELTYGAVEKDYYAFLDAFRRVARTFEFHEEDTEEKQEFRPLVTPTPTLAIRERPADYETNTK